MRPLRLIIIAVLSIVAYVAPFACAKEKVDASLLANVASIAPGEPFEVGVLLKIAPGWHIYWLNPGNGGLPTRVKLNLPQGFSASAVAYPIPHRFDQPGGIIGYGYEDEVLLTATVTPPGKLDPGHTVNVAADVSWLSCADVCVLGKSKVTTNLPVAESRAAPANAELFSTWKERVPVVLAANSASLKSVPNLNISDFGLARDNDAGRLVAHIKWTTAPGDLEWFPLPPEGSAVKEAIAALADSRATFAFNLVPWPKSANDMQFVLAYKDQNGNRRAIQFKESIPSPAK